MLSHDSFEGKKEPPQRSQPGPVSICEPSRRNQSLTVKRLSVSIQHAKRSSCSWRPEVSSSTITPSAATTSPGTTNVTCGRSSCCNRRLASLLFAASYENSDAGRISRTNGRRNGSSGYCEFAAITLGKYLLLATSDPPLLVSGSRKSTSASSVFVDTRTTVGSI
jgi:hypothetical protein